MSVREYDDLLQLESEEEGSDDGYDSGEESKITRGSKKKTRKVQDEDGDEDMSASSEHEDDDEATGAKEDKHDNKRPHTQKEKGQEARSTETPSSNQDNIAKLKSKAKKDTERKRKTGVVYLSSLPPYLKPSALKTLITQRGFGPINRVFLTPADPPGRLKRNRRRMYADGWVEFVSKRSAKLCAETLNATIVGGKKGGWYHDDIWNMKYLRGFKWDDLMEQVQRERKEREAKQRVEDARARKEQKLFLASVEKGRAVDGMRKKKEEKGEAAKTDVRRVFRQNKVADHDKNASKPLDSNVQRVLSQIF